MKKEAINPETVWKPEDYFNIYHSPGLPKTAPQKSGWEQAVRHGNWLFISGQTPTSPDGETVAKDMHAQLRQALENTRNILKSVGGTADDIVSIRYYFKATWKKGSRPFEISGAITSKARTRPLSASKWYVWHGLIICSRSKQWRILGA